MLVPCQSRSVAGLPYPRGVGRRRSARREATPEAGREPASARLDESAEWNGEEYVVRRLTGSASTKPYRCPGCDHEIRPVTPHVVAWPAADPDAGLRRHWHSACWRARDRRAVRAVRSRGAPRHG
jgi:hypothetical protein